jgi:hypothetical protein
MKRMFLMASLTAAFVLVAANNPASAQTNEIAALRAEIAKQEVVIAQLLKRIEALETQQAPLIDGDGHGNGNGNGNGSAHMLEDDIRAQEDSINSLREIVNTRVNLNGYYNFRFSADGSSEHSAFQQHHLGMITSKQLGKFNFLMELELQNVPHHREIAPEDGGDGAEGGDGERETDISGEGQVAVENAWMEYNHNRLFAVRVGKQLSPQYWSQNHYPNLTLSTSTPIYLRELFPAELVGLMVQGSAGKPAGQSELAFGYKFYVANNNFEGNSRSDLRDGKSWGARGQLRLPAKGALRKLDVAGDIYRGHVGLTNLTLADDNVYGFESQLELSRFLFQSEWARGKSLGQTRTGYYLQPAVRLHEEWITFYRAEQLDSPRLFRAERRHIAGLNFRPYPQIAIKGEFYRTQPLDREFLHSEEGEGAEGAKPYNGFATAAVFFF